MSLQWILATSGAKSLVNGYNRDLPSMILFPDEPQEINAQMTHRANRTRQHWCPPFTVDATLEALCESLNATCFLLKNIMIGFNPTFS